MRITITARHCEIPDELRLRARTLLERLRKVATRPHDAQVLFSEDHSAPTVEVRLHTARGVVHVGTADGTDHRSALDRAAAKVRRQLGKAAPKRRRMAAARRALERQPR
ncbi:MAG TPA: HPF/RaiA family ribosome-associated protein [Gemmatimonadales bacterium]|nr:HPF/RaiA family ribosome-associated protein [Gemmatimonadales bacterium]